MATTVKTKLEIKSWDENPYREQGGTKFTRAEVALKGTDESVTGDATFESLMYYPSEKGSTYVTLMQLDGSIRGRSGTVVMQGSGAWDGTTATMDLTIVSGTGELEGITGSARSESTHADYPNMPLTLTYTLK
jgi:hypothetical protein